MPNLLVIDTSFDACAVALSWQNKVYSQKQATLRQHNEFLLPMIQSLLEQADVDLSQLDGIAFGQGPGSFTGVRIATCVAQALAYAKSLPVIAVSSLATLAMGVGHDTACNNIAIALDARMHSVYFGLYQRNASGLMDTIAESQTEVAKVYLPEAESYLCVGDAWQTYGISTGIHSFKPLALELNAEHMLLLAVDKFKRGELLTPEQAVPIYFTDKQWRKKTQS